MAAKVYSSDVTLEDHSVQVDGVRDALSSRPVLLAGFLARDYCSRKELGYVWTLGGVWHWRSMTGNHYGERQTKRAAVETLRDAWRLRQGVTPPPPSTQGILAAWRSQRSSDPRVGPSTASRVTTEQPKIVKAPARRVVWGDSATAIPDLRNAIANAFTRHTGGK